MYQGQGATWEGVMGGTVPSPTFVFKELESCHMCVCVWGCECVFMFSIHVDTCVCLGASPRVCVTLSKHRGRGGRWDPTQSLFTLFPEADLPGEARARQCGVSTVNLLLGVPPLCGLRPESWVFCQPCICVGSGSEDNQILALTPEQQTL